MSFTVKGLAVKEHLSVCLHLNDGDAGSSHTEPNSKSSKALLMLAAIQHSRVWIVKKVLLTGVCIKRCEDTGSLAVLQCL